MASNPAANSAKPSQGPSKADSSSYAQAASSDAGRSQDGSGAQAAKKRKHRGGKKRRNRRQSFAAPPESVDGGDMTSDQRPSLLDVGNQASSKSTLYRLGANQSNTSLDSEALLDHRAHSPMQTRRQSVQPTKFNYRPSQPRAYPSPRREHAQNPFSQSKLSRQFNPGARENDGEDEEADDRTPLMPSSHRTSRPGSGYGGFSNPSSTGKGHERSGRRTSHSSTGSQKRRAGYGDHSQTNLADYDVNNPPSVPGSPILGPDVGYDDVMITGDLERSRSSDDRRHSPSRDALINIDEEPGPYNRSNPQSPDEDVHPELRRRMTALMAEGDVCFPQEGMSELGQDDYMHRQEGVESRNRRRKRRWPVLSVLEDWSTEEKEQRTMEGDRVRKVSEPLMVGGRLRPQKQVWHREADDAPYRFTYFNEEFQSTIHSQTISELLQPGQTFKDLFIPEPPVLDDTSDESDSEEDTPMGQHPHHHHHHHSNANGAASTDNSRLGDLKQESSGEQSRAETPRPSATATPQPGKQKRYGPRPSFWLDVLSPTEAEMKVLAQAFGIHPLTSEDIMMQEAREKVELFRNYYFVNYRSFEQDPSSEDYMEPVNMYVIVFREGVISFHFSMTPHPANVRRRIRQLSDYLILSPDWISYAIIDDITDVYAPLIEKIEEEVDDIDDAILCLHSDEDEDEKRENKKRLESSGDYEKLSEIEDAKPGAGADMLRRVGECRKRVMSLYRLLGNKADVIKGFAKRCNEHWDVAPRSEIGLYLGDIQDHIVTMTGNLTHYENLLSRAHSNYLAQINIRMNERQEVTSDILGKLTVLGTIVLPMNIVTGMWGMNTKVPGQEVDNLWWFFGITAGLFAFGVSCYFIAKRVYKIV